MSETTTHVRFVERARELAHEIARARVTVRLERDDDAAILEPGARAGERGADLGGVVAVVVDDHDAARLAAYGEAPADAAEAGERALIDVEVDAEEIGDGEHGEGVEDVVPPRHRQLHSTQASFRGRSR